MPKAREGDVGAFVAKFTGFGYNDMCSLPKLTKDAILSNLKKRFVGELVYTYVGDIVVSTNPFKDVGCVGKAIRSRYKGGKEHAKLPPHIYALVDMTYSQMMENSISQSILISGESGAGKTEAMKISLSFLGELSASSKAKGKGGGGGGDAGENDVSGRLMSTNPVMEALGNAKTIRNNNSSRFGKHFDIQFAEDGAILGAFTSTYLLEKPRICVHMKGERNYHIYYMLCKASEDIREPVQVKEWQQYGILKQEGTIAQVTSWNDDAEFKDMHAAFLKLGFNVSQREELYMMLSASMHVGNVGFKEDEGGNAKVEESNKVDHVATMLQVDAVSLNKALTSKTMGGGVVEVYNKPLEPKQAVSARNSIVMQLYSLVFDWCVEKINKEIAVASADFCVGILDIFGFENFGVNSFPQLCINFTNESLHNLFIEHVFKLEQETYVREEVEWKFVDYDDNQHVLDLIAKRPLCIYGQLDEGCVNQAATDASVLINMHGVFANGKPQYRAYQKPKKSPDRCFQVSHYAGDVIYTIEGFVEKNKDALSQDICELLEEKTAWATLKELALNDKQKKEDADAAADAKKKTKGGGGKKKKTVGRTFGDSLKALMTKLGSTEKHYIRCLKPNQTLQAGDWDAEFMYKQLAYSGTMEVTEIRKAGLNVRRPLKHFYMYYKICADDQKTLVGDSIRERCLILLEPMPLDKDLYRVGKTIMFLKNVEMLDALDKIREVKIVEYVIELQSLIRMVKDRKVYLRKRKAIMRIQANIKTFEIRRALADVKAATSYIQNVARSYVARVKLRECLAMDPRPPMERIQAVVMNVLFPPKDRTKGYKMSLNDGAADEDEGESELPSFSMHHESYVLARWSSATEEEGMMEPLKLYCVVYHGAVTLYRDHQYTNDKTIALTMPLAMASIESAREGEVRLTQEANVLAPAPPQRRTTDQFEPEQESNSVEASKPPVSAAATSAAGGGGAADETEAKRVSFSADGDGGNGGGAVAVAAAGGSGGGGADETNNNKRKSKAPRSSSSPSGAARPSSSSAAAARKSRASRFGRGKVAPSKPALVVTLLELPSDDVDYEKRGAGQRRSSQYGMSVSLNARASSVRTTNDAHDESGGGNKSGVPVSATNHVFEGRSNFEGERASDMAVWFKALSAARYEALSMDAVRLVLRKSLADKEYGMPAPSKADDSIVIEGWLWAKSIARNTQWRRHYYALYNTGYLVRYEWESRRARDESGRMHMRYFSIECIKSTNPLQKSIELHGGMAMSEDMADGGIQSGEVVLAEGKVFAMQLGETIMLKSADEGLLFTCPTNKEDINDWYRVIRMVQASLYQLAPTLSQSAVVVLTVDGKTTLAPITNSTRVGDLVSIVCDRLFLNNSEEWAITERWDHAGIWPGVTQRRVGNDVNVVDELKGGMEQGMRKQHGVCAYPSTNMFQLVLRRVRCFAPRTRKSKPEVKLDFHQAASDLRAGRFEPREGDSEEAYHAEIAMLCALILYVDIHEELMAAEEVASSRMSMSGGGGGGGGSRMSVARRQRNSLMATRRDAFDMRDHKPKLVKGQGLERGLDELLPVDILEPPSPSSSSPSPASSSASHVANGGPVPSPPELHDHHAVLEHWEDQVIEAFGYVNDPETMPIREGGRTLLEQALHEHLMEVPDLDSISAMRLCSERLMLSPRCFSTEFLADLWLPEERFPVLVAIGRAGIAISLHPTVYKREPLMLLHMPFTSLINWLVLDSMLVVNAVLTSTTGSGPAGHEGLSSSTKHRRKIHLIMNETQQAFDLLTRYAKLSHQDMLAATKAPGKGGGSGGAGGGEAASKSEAAASSSSASTADMKRKSKKASRQSQKQQQQARASREPGSGRASKMRRASQAAESTTPAASDNLIAPTAAVRASVSAQKRASAVLSGSAEDEATVDAGNLAVKRVTILEQATVAEADLSLAAEVFTQPVGEEQWEERLSAMAGQGLLSLEDLDADVVPAPAADPEIVVAASEDAGEAV